MSRENIWLDSGSIIGQLTADPVLSAPAGV